MVRRMFYKKELSQIVKTIRDKYRPEKILLFGSMARGDFREGSDIDMLIIKKSNKKRRVRSAEVLNAVKGVNRRLAFGPIVMTPDEFNQGVNNNRYFFREIINNSRVLYEAR